MCGFNFVVFLSAFQLLPTAPFRILDIGGGTVQAGLFLGFLTYASAFSAPFTGAIADRIGRRRTLIICSTAIFLMSFAYGMTTTWPPMLAIVFVHGLFWSGLLTAAGAYVTDLMPASRRAEGIGYYGISTILAVAIAPAVGLWVYQHGWLWLCVSIGTLNLAMAIIATQLAESPRNIVAEGTPWLSHEVLEWRVTIVSLTLFLLSFGYGGVTSFVAIYSKELGVTPPSLFFSVCAVAMVLTRPFSGTLADRIGPVKVLAPCLLLTSLGLCAAGDWRIEGHVDCRGARLRHGLRLGVSGVRGVRDASRRGHEARRGVRRHPRGARHGDRLRLDHAGLDHPASRFFGGVWHGGVRGLACAPVVPVHAPARARASIDRDFLAHTPTSTIPTSVRPTDRPIQRPTTPQPARKQSHQPTGRPIIQCPIRL